MFTWIVDSCTCICYRTDVNDFKLSEHQQLRHNVRLKTYSLPVYEFLQLELINTRISQLFYQTGYSGMSVSDQRWHHFVFLSSCLRLSGSYYSLAVTSAAAATNVRYVHASLSNIPGFDVISFSHIKCISIIRSSQLRARWNCIDLCRIIFE